MTKRTDIVLNLCYTHSDTKGGSYGPPLVSLCPQNLGCPIGHIRTKGEVI
jgi:hypothetical protein